jgi:hypothetical protein
MSARRLVAVNWSFSALKAEVFFERRGREGFAENAEEVRKVIQKAIQKEKPKFEIQFWFFSFKVRSSFWFYFCIVFSAFSA